MRGNIMLKRFSKFIVTNPAKAAIVFTIVTCFLGFHLFYLEIDLRPQATYTTYEDNNELNNRFVKEFGSDDNWLILMITSRHIFTPTGMALIQELTYKIAAIPELQNTKSLINIPEIRSIKGEGLEVVSFSDPLPETKADFQQLKKRAMINPLYKKLYISSDGNST
ncbi:MAG: hypothetical protein GY870_15985, partial [archaeon]|nr:hypothetical protein [archaeon]